MNADTTPGTPENALRELELSVVTQADRDRIALVRSWLAGWQRDCLAAVAREQRGHNDTICLAEVRTQIHRARAAELRGAA